MHKNYNALRTLQQNTGDLAFYHPNRKTNANQVERSYYTQDIICKLKWQKSNTQNHKLATDHHVFKKRVSTRLDITAIVQ